jgi:hypothetical protein
MGYSSVMTTYEDEPRPDTEPDDPNAPDTADSDDEGDD